MEWKKHLGIVFLPSIYTVWVEGNILIVTADKSTWRVGLSRPLTLIKHPEPSLFIIEERNDKTII